MPVGRPSIFSPKHEDIHGQVSRIGSGRFAAARKTLAKLSGWKRVSDGDVIEYLCNYHHLTYRYLSRELGIEHAQIAAKSGEE